MTIALVGGGMLASCGGEEFVPQPEPDVLVIDGRKDVAHEVTVALDGGGSRVGYAPVGDGLQLSWDASEMLGVYIQKADNSMLYAGTVVSNGNAGDRGTRRFSGMVAAKTDGEQYVYLHPVIPGGLKGVAAEGSIDYSSQEGRLGSTEHLGRYVPLVWHEGTALVENNGYAVHLTLTFTENPGTISKVMLQTMPGVGETDIFPTSFEVSGMTVGGALGSSMTLEVTGGEAAESNGLWTAEAYIACSHSDVNVFRTKYDVKVEAANGTYYNEFRSFPGQQEATAITGLQMLANGRCYNMETAMSRDVAPTVVNSNYKINSLLGMWNQYGKVTDPFTLTKSDGEVPAQLKSSILYRKDDVMARILTKKSQQGTPTFTWDLLVKQITQSGSGVLQTNVTYNNLLITQETEVYVTFLSEYGWNQNLLGYYHYPTAGGAPASPGNLLKTIIFPNVSKPGHVPFNRDGVDGGANVNPNGPAKNIGDMADAPLQEFTTAQLLYNNPDGTYTTKFPAGTTIGFMSMRDTQANGGSDDSATPLIDWTAWRLFTNTAWNSSNAGWYGGNCWNFFVSGKVMGTDGNVIDGIAVYGVKDDRDHNYDYSFSSMLFLVSSSDASAMTVQVPGALNLGAGDLVK